MLNANVPESSAVAELLAVAISASADALALAASVVLRMPTALAAFLSLVISASADALALAAGVVLAAAMPTAFAAFLSFVISASADALAFADLPAFAVTAVSALARAALHVVLLPLPRRWASILGLHKALSVRGARPPVATYHAVLSFPQGLLRPPALAAEPHHQRSMSSSTEQLALGVELREDGSLLLEQRPGRQADVPDWPDSSGGAHVLASQLPGVEEGVRLAQVARQGIHGTLREHGHLVVTGRPQ